MEISKETILHVAKLARLKLNPEEIEMYTNQLASIINFADKLNELDVENTPETAHILPIQNVLREDEVTPSFDRDEILKNAPTQAKGCILVPKVVE